MFRLLTVAACLANRARIKPLDAIIAQIFLQLKVDDNT